MSEPVHTPSNEPRKPVGHGWRRWLTIVAVVVAVSGVVTAVALVGNRGEKAGAPATSTTATTSTTTPPSSSTTIPTATATTTPTSNRPSAAKTLAPFLSAAMTLDKQLKAAATAINRAGPPWREVSEEIASTVKAAELAPVAQAIPAGLPPDLLRSVVLVYSDLASRRYAMEDFSHQLTIDPNAYPNNQDLLQSLGNGHAAAARFPADLAATRSLAAATPAVATPPATARAAAEVQLYARYVEIANGGCGTRGGDIMTELPAIIWNSSGGGTIGGVTFTAEIGADSTWHVRLIAC